MKKYMKPELAVVTVAAELSLLAGSGVETGSTLGEEYASTDVTYARQTSVWGDDEGEEF